MEGQPETEWRQERIGEVVREMGRRLNQDGG